MHPDPRMANSIVAAASVQRTPMYTLLCLGLSVVQVISFQHQWRGSRFSGQQLHFTTPFINSKLYLLPFPHALLHIPEYCARKPFWISRFLNLHSTASVLSKIGYRPWGKEVRA